MGYDLFDRINRTLHLGEPDPIERAAIAIAAQEFEEADVDLPLWREAEAGARDKAHPRERCTRRCVTRLRRELRAGSQPLLFADLADRDLRSEELARLAAAYRATLEIAWRGMRVFSVLYFAVAPLILLFGLWLGSGARD